MAIQPIFQNNNNNNDNDNDDEGSHSIIGAGHPERIHNHSFTSSIDHYSITNNNNNRTNNNNNRNTKLNINRTLEPVIPLAKRNFYSGDFGLILINASCQPMNLLLGTIGVTIGLQWYDCLLLMFITSLVLVYLLQRISYIPLKHSITFPAYARGLFGIYGGKLISVLRIGLLLIYNGLCLFYGSQIIYKGIYRFIHGDKTAVEYAEEHFQEDSNNEMIDDSLLLCMFIYGMLHLILYIMGTMKCIRILQQLIVPCTMSLFFGMFFWIVVEIGISNCLQIFLHDVANGNNFTDNNNNRSHGEVVPDDSTGTAETSHMNVNVEMGSDNKHDDGNDLIASSSSTSNQEKDNDNDNMDMDIFLSNHTSMIWCIKALIFVSIALGLWSFTIVSTPDVSIYSACANSYRVSCIMYIPPLFTISCFFGMLFHGLCVSRLLVDHVDIEPSDLLLQYSNKYIILGASIIYGLSMLLCNLTFCFYPITNDIKALCPRVIGSFSSGLITLLLSFGMLILNDFVPRTFYIKNYWIISTILSSLIGCFIASSYNRKWRRDILKKNYVLGINVRGFLCLAMGCFLIVLLFLSTNMNHNDLIFGNNNNDYNHFTSKSNKLKEIIDNDGNYDILLYSYLLPMLLSGLCWYLLMVLPDTCRCPSKKLSARQKRERDRRKISEALEFDLEEFISTDENDHTDHIDHNNDNNKYNHHKPSAPLPFNNSDSNGATMELGASTGHTTYRAREVQPPMQVQRSYIANVTAVEVKPINNNN